MRDDKLIAGLAKICENARRLLNGGALLLRGVAERIMPESYDNLLLFFPP